MTQDCLSCKSLKCLLSPYFLQLNMGNKWERHQWSQPFKSGNKRLSNSFTSLLITYDKENYVKSKSITGKLENQRYYFNKI